MDDRWDSSLNEQVPDDSWLTNTTILSFIYIGTLTVRETLLFSAELRLPENIGKEAKKKRVEVGPGEHTHTMWGSYIAFVLNDWFLTTHWQDVIRELGLEKCADSFIGTELIRGISGGKQMYRLPKWTQMKSTHPNQIHYLKWNRWNEEMQSRTWACEWS